jgi:hypothetical protein
VSSGRYILVGFQGSCLVWFCNFQSDMTCLVWAIADTWHELIPTSKICPVRIPPDNGELTS